MAKKDKNQGSGVYVRAAKPGAGGYVKQGAGESKNGVFGGFLGGKKTGVGRRQTDESDGKDFGGKSKDKGSSGWGSTKKVERFGRWSKDYHPDRRELFSQRPARMMYTRTDGPGCG
jgi:hypothetical protein